MRPTFLGFETARKGLVANQKGIDIVGQNLTNINTSGYTRQRVDFVSTHIGSTGRNALGKNSMSGQGVDIKGISQVRDSFLDKRFREEYSDVGMYDQTTKILEDIESALDEVTSKGLKEGLKNLLKSLNDFSKNPDQSTHANIVLTAAKGIAQVLNQFNIKLDNIMEQQKFNASITVNEFNSLLESISNLNKSISSDIFLGGSNYGPNELLDQRNSFLDELSKYGKITVTDNNDGSVKVVMDGKVIIDGPNHDYLYMEEDPSEKTISFNWQSTGNKINATSGTFKSFDDMINGMGAKATGNNGNFEQGIPYYRDKINNFALNFSKIFNSTMQVAATNAVYTIPAPAVLTTAPYTATVRLNGIDINYTVNGATIQEQTRDLVRQLNQDITFSTAYQAEVDVDGNIKLTAKNAGVDSAFEGITGFNAMTGANSFTITTIGLDAGTVTKTLFEPADLSLVNASNITVSKEWADNPDYIMVDLNGDGKYDNTYIMALVKAFSTDYDYGDFKGTFEGYVNSYNANLGQQIAFNDGRFEASAGIADEILNRRDSISGVSMDEEGTSLMIYDKAYKAVSRVMTALDEALDVLINGTGLVGR